MDDVIGYVMRYGGMCRDCADADGVCPTTGMPCATDQCRATIEHTLKALEYGIKHRFIENPFGEDDRRKGFEEAREMAANTVHDNWGQNCTFICAAIRKLESPKQ